VPGGCRAAHGGSGTAGFLMLSLLLLLRRRNWTRTAR
jgi:uncharacterized protein (TIGR03382 family)